MAAEATPQSTAPHTPGADADPNSSSSTLINHDLPSASPPEPASPASPFSASFDPNASTPSVDASLTTPLAIRQGPFHPLPLGDVQLRPGAADANALWAHRLSASFGAIAEQIAAASRALAVPPVPPSPTVAGALEGRGLALMRFRNRAEA